MFYFKYWLQFAQAALSMLIITIFSQPKCFEAPSTGVARGSNRFVVHYEQAGPRFSESPFLNRLASHLLSS